VEAGRLGRERLVLRDLVGPVAEAVDVHRHGKALGPRDALLAGDHVLRELVDDEQLLGQVVLDDDVRDVACDLIDLVGGDTADLLPGDLAVADLPLRIEREPDVGL